MFATVCLRYRGRNVIQHCAYCLMLWVFRYVKELLSSPSLAYFVALLMHTAERNVIQLTWGNWGLDVKNLFLRQR